MNHSADDRTILKSVGISECLQCAKALGSKIALTRILFAFDLARCRLTFSRLSSNFQSPLTVAIFACAELGSTSLIPEGFR